MVAFDLRDITRVTKNLERFADQIPFALARSLNDAAEIGRRNDLPAIWAGSIHARDPNFIRSALTTQGTRATKKLLRVVVYDRFGRANLKLHDVGGTRRPRGQAIAVPNKTNLQPRRNSKGVPKGLRPRNLPNAFVKESKYGKVIFERVGKYQKGSKGQPGKDNRRLKAMYGLAPSVPIHADVPFTDTFDRLMRREVKRAFAIRIRQAMATARR